MPSTGLAEVAVTMLASKCVNPWAMLAFPGIFMSPFLAAAFGISALVAPGMRSRRALFGAADIESVSSVYGFPALRLPRLAVAIAKPIASRTLARIQPWLAV